MNAIESIQNFSQGSDTDRQCAELSAGTRRLWETDMHGDDGDVGGQWCKSWERSEEEMRRELELRVRI
jgi:hypothetical protein